MGVPFSDVADVILQAGYSPNFVQDVRVRFLKDFPRLEAESFDTAASTVQPDPVAPEDWVDRLFAELQIDVHLEPSEEPI
jgi:hypothetical protein